MSLQDLVPVILATRHEPARTRKTWAEYHARWLNKPGNCERFNEYRRAWYRKRKEMKA